MTWIKDYNEIMVNIDNWDFLDYVTIEDIENSVIAYKVFLSSRDGNEHTLGYLNAARDRDAEDILKSITLGFQPDFDHLNFLIYFSKHKEFSDEGLDPGIEKVDKLIGTRFVESQ